MGNWPYSYVVIFGGCYGIYNDIIALKFGNITRFLRVAAHYICFYAII